MTEPREPLTELFERARILRSDAARIATDQALRNEDTAEQAKQKAAEEELQDIQSSELIKTFVDLVTSNYVTKSTYLYGNAHKASGWVIRDFTNGRVGGNESGYINPVYGLIILENMTIGPWEKKVVTEGLTSVIMPYDGMHAFNNIDKEFGGFKSKNRSLASNNGLLTDEGQSLLANFIAKSRIPIPTTKPTHDI